MKHLKKIFLIFVGILFFNSFFFSAWSYQKDKLYKLTLLHTNDTHGPVLAMPAVSTLIKKIRNEVKDNGGYVLLLSAGDITYGNPYSDLFKTEPDIKAMNLLKYDASAIGNHEFDFGIETFNNNIALAKFPFLAANIFEKNSNTPIYKQFIIKNLDELNVGLVGFTTIELPILAKGGFPDDKYFVKKSVKVAQKLLPKLKKDSDILIALTHLGYDKKGGKPEDNDIFLANNTNGIDIIVGGHSHTELPKPDHQNGAYIVQTGEKSGYLGRMDLEFINGNLTLKSYKLIPINARDKNGKLLNKGIPEDKEMLKLLAPYKTKADKVLSEKIGRTDAYFDGDRKSIRYHETNLGNLFTTIMAKETNADVAIVSSGLIRSSLPKGNVTFGDVLKIRPGDMELVTVDMTGKELKKYVEKIIHFEKGKGAFPQFYGLKVELKNGKPDIVISIKKENSFEKTAANKKYTLALLDFNAQGGDGYPKLDAKPSYKKANLTSQTAIRNFFAKNKIVRGRDYEVTRHVQRP